MLHTCRLVGPSWLSAAGCLDAVLCIAVLHHISSQARRLRLIAELARALAPGGRALVTVWASEQEEPGKLAKWQPIPGPTGVGCSNNAVHHCPVQTVSLRFACRCTHHSMIV